MGIREAAVNFGLVDDFVLLQPLGKVLLCSPPLSLKNLQKYFHH